MANQEKKKIKLQERRVQLESDLRLSLQKKSSSAAEIDVPGKTQQIAELRKQIASP
jgi:flagellar basal body-associated protein FliL